MGNTRDKILGLSKTVGSEIWEKKHKNINRNTGWEEGEREVCQHNILKALCFFCSVIYLKQVKTVS